MDHPINRIIQGDCIAGLGSVPARTVDLAFADPPFNIGYEYDRYQDNRPPDEYLDWSEEWMSAVKRVLKPSGAFWLAIGDEYAAELKVIATRNLGFYCRSWVVWYYTFGVHCESKFTRSHAHLFHFVVDPKSFVFNASEVRVPSARQLVYADKRANPKGRVPDDTWLVRPVPHESWILRPQDLPEGFAADSDTWYFPRVCGTFRERMGFHGCQMPEQLLGRVVRACSNVNDIVLDPFAGSGTTLAVAKKLNRRYLGFELSPDYAREAKRRLDRIKIGTPLDGSENPLAQTPIKRKKAQPDRESNVNHQRRAVKGMGDVEREIVDVFDTVRDGFSTDRVIADPAMNAEFISLLSSRGVPGTPADWNLALFRLRKAHRLRVNGKTKRTKLDAEKLEQCEFAAEIALGQIRNRHEVTLDSLLCEPALAQEFDQLASEMCPGFEALYYRWAALRIRKYRKNWQEAGRNLSDILPPLRFLLPKRTGTHQVPSVPGLYGVCVDANFRYVGDAANLHEWFIHANDKINFSKLSKNGTVEIKLCALDSALLGRTPLISRKGAKAIAISRKKPSWNLMELAA